MHWGYEYDKLPLTRKNSSCILAIVLILPQRGLDNAKSTSRQEKGISIALEGPVWRPTLIETYNGGPIALPELIRDEFGGSIAGAAQGHGGP